MALVGATASTERQPTQTIPAPFLLSRKRDGSCDIAMRKYNMAQFNGLAGMDDMLREFAQLLGPTRPGTWDMDIHHPQFLQSIALEQKYENRVVPFLGQILDATVMNSRASFLTSLLCPWFPTNEFNFSVEVEEPNATPFSRISELGVADEQTHQKRGWTSSIQKMALNARTTRDIAYDPNFGLDTWMKELSWMSSNIVLTANLVTIWSFLATGWGNIVGRNAHQERQNHDKMMQAELRHFGLAAIDQDRYWAEICNFEALMPNFDTVIIAGGDSRYLRDIRGESTTIPAWRPWENPETQEIQLRLYNGPDSAKTIRLGNGRVVNTLELPDFIENTQSPTRYQPLTRRVTMGQYHGPNPRASPHDPVFSNDPNRSTWWLYYQTASTGQLKPVTLHQRLAGCHVYDNKGHPAQKVHDFVRELNESGMRELWPWPWNPKNPHADTDADINKDTGSSYSHPDLSEVRGKQNLHDMLSFRAQPCFIAFDPAQPAAPWYVPHRMMGFMLSALPNAQIHQAAKHLALEVRLRTGRDDLEAAFEMVDSIVAAFRDAEWTDPYVHALINKNIRRMLVKKGDNAFDVEPHRTARKKLDHYKGAREIAEFKANSDGVLDLPDRDGAMMSTNVPPGYASGAGLIYVAREANKPGSLWREAGLMAQKVVKFFAEVMAVVSDNINKRLDAIRGENAPEWVQSENALAVLIDSYIQPEGPVFLGVPSGVTGYKPTVVGGAQPGAFEGGPMPVTHQWSNTTGFEQTIRFLTLLETSQKVAFQREILVTNRERVLACLFKCTPTALVQIRNRLLEIQQGYSAGLLQQIERLLSLLLETAQYYKSPTENRIGAAYVIAMGAIKTLDDAPPDEKEVALESYIDAVDDAKEKKTLQSFLAPYAKDHPTSESGAAAALPVVKALREYEERDLTVGGQWKQVTGDESLQEEEIRRRRRETVLGRGVEYEADFNRAPVRYLRASATSSDALRHYISDKGTQGIHFILPANPNENFESAETPLMVQEKMAAAVGVQEEKEAGGNVELKAYKMFSGIRPLMGRVSSSGGGGGGNVEGMALDGESDLFASMRDSRPFEFDVQHLLQFGAKEKPSSSAHARSERRRLFEEAVEASDQTGKLENEIREAMRHHHRGPVRARLHFIEHEISSKGEAFFFKLILEAPNELDTLLNLAKIDARLFDVMLTRQFQTFLMNMTVIMEGGPNTCLYGYGHSTIDVTRDHRGLFTIGAAFWSGVIMLNLNGINLMLNAIPRGFIGGRKLDFLKDPRMWSVQDPNGHESCIAFLVPAVENEFGGFLNARNEPPYASPDEHDALWEKKCSSFGPWYDFWLSGQKPAMMDAVWSARGDCWASKLVHVAHTLSLGPTIYIDPTDKDGKKFDLEGEGGLGSRRANIGSAYLTHNGQSYRFPNTLEYAHDLL